jgi:hypothetical protein
MDELVRTALNAAEAVFADVIERIDHLPRVEAFLFVDLVDTVLFYTTGTPQASLFPGDDA